MGKSLPSRERGLKYAGHTAVNDRFCVAPFAGAWIEIHADKLYFPMFCVAPFAGAWIEILKEPMRIFPGSSSLPSRERGLKC